MGTEWSYPSLNAAPWGFLPFAVTFNNQEPKRGPGVKRLSMPCCRSPEGGKGTNTLIKYYYINFSKCSFRGWGSFPKEAACSFSWSSSTACGHFLTQVSEAATRSWHLPKKAQLISFSMAQDHKTSLERGQRELEKLGLQSGGRWWKEEEQLSAASSWTREVARQKAMLNYSLKTAAGLQKHKAHWLMLSSA